MFEFCVGRSQPARARRRLDFTFRLVALCTAALVLNSCAYWKERFGEPAAPPRPAVTKPAPSVTQTTPQPAPAPKPRRVARDSRDTKEPEKVASVDPKNLIGLQPAAVERLLGSPSNVSSNDPSLVWTYAGQGCSFQVFFYPDLKTATFHALKYSSTAGEQADNACIRNILTVKSNGPS